MLIETKPGSGSVESGFWQRRKWIPATQDLDSSGAGWFQRCGRGWFSRCRRDGSSGAVRDGSRDVGGMVPAVRAGWF